jgi:hypothetical protein
MNPRLSKRGNALLLALGATTTLIVAAGTLLVAVTQERTATEQSVVNAQARDASTSGAEDALARLSVDPDWEGTFAVDMGGPVADVIVVDWGKDSVDNDDDGTKDEDDEEDLIFVTSTGRSNETLDNGGNVIDLPTRHSHSVTEVLLRRTDLNLAANQAVYVDDPNALFKFAGTAFLVNGKDTNIDGSSGPDAALPGIGTVGDPAGITAQLKANQQDNVVGDGGPPSVAQVSDMDMMTTMEMLRPLASVSFNGPDDSFSGSLGDLNGLKPVVAYAKGNLKLHGNTTGCGILIVDGDVDFSGTFDYAGIIYASGAIRFNGGGGDKNLRGALFTLGAVSGEDVTINGGVELNYSSEAIAMVNQNLSGGVEVLSWRRK